MVTKQNNYLKIRYLALAEEAKDYRKKSLRKQGEALTWTKTETIHYLSLSPKRQDFLPLPTPQTFQAKPVQFYPT